jgi:DNA-binding transcriptional ArsR family regulator
MSPLGDPSRRAIFEHLARQPSSVGELADRLPITRQAVSQHLQVLRDAGLVVATAVGTKRIYRLDPRGIEALRSYLQTIWDHALTSFEKAADATAPHPPEE